MKAIVTRQDVDLSNDWFIVDVVYFDNAGAYVLSETIPVSVSGVNNAKDLRDATIAVIISDASNNEYTITESDVFMTFPSFATEARSVSYPSRSLNSSFQPSTSRDCEVHYSVEVASELSLTSGEVGTVYLETADDSGFSTNVHEIARAVNGNTGTLAVGLDLTQTICSELSGLVPAGKYCRIRTANTTGTPTFTMRAQQEVLL